MPRVYASARERILDAAERVLLRDGLGHLSIDAVLAEAGVSKGGFFHHFATRDALLGAITRRLSAHVQTRLEQAAARDRRPGNRLLRAQIELAFDMSHADHDRLRALVLALVEAASANPAIAAEMRAVNGRATAPDALAGIPLGRVLLVVFALDGYFVGESLGTIALDARQRSALRRALLELVLPSAAPRVRKPATRARKRAS